MIKSLFNGEILPPTQEELQDRWQDGYAAELLERPPVNGLMQGNPAREKNAARYARQDLARALSAAKRAGLRIVLEPLGKDGAKS